MANGSMIDSIELVLTGTQPIPENVSNRLLLAAIRANYQANLDNEGKHKIMILSIKENAQKIQALNLDMQVQAERIDELRKTSNRWDKILGAIAGISAALGYYFGGK